MSSVSTDRFNVISLMQFRFVRTSVVPDVAFALSLLTPQLSFFWYLGKAQLHDCGISGYLHLIR